MWILLGVLGSMLALLAFTKLTDFLSAEQRALRALRRLPPTPALNVKEGTLALVQGRVRAREQILEAPLSGRQCVAFRVYARLLDPEEPEIIPRTCELAFAAAPFEIADESARILVDATTAQLELKADFETREPTYALRKIWQYPTGRAKPVTFHEVVLRADELVRVAGTARVAEEQSQEGASPYRDRHTLCLRAEKLPVIIRPARQKEG